MPSRRASILACLVLLVAGSAVAGAAGAGGGSARAGGGNPRDVHDLPLGDGRTTTSGPRAGSVFECRVTAGGGGSQQAGPWIHADGTFDLTAKAVVDGSVAWPGRISFRARGSRLLVSGNDLPVAATTGVFPIAPADDAYQYDRNPNAIASQQITWSLPASPKVAVRPSCLPGGPIGIAVDGVAIFDALDGENRDAVAHETQDACEGHPERSGMYHYHSIPPCLTKGNATGLVGYALDGFPILGPREGGKLLTDADLDACHGHVGWITLRGRRVRMYHYHATLEYPYTLGCFKGTPARVASAAAAGPPGGPPSGPPGGPPDGPPPPRP